MSIGKKWEKSPANSIIFTKFASPSAVFQPAHSTCNKRTAKPTPTAEERFAEYLRSNRKRRTAERFAILDRVMATQGHFSAEELCEMMRRDDYPVSVATVYATLELLVNCGLAVMRRFADKANLYERASASAPDHHHLICTSCGKIKEVRDQALTDLIASRRFAGFTQSYFSLNIYGTCGACNRKRRGKNDKEK